MFDHVKFGVSDYPASKAFLLKVLEPLGVTLVTKRPPNNVELTFVRHDSIQASDRRIAE